MLSTLLKALGISMTPEAIAELETLLPRIPGMVRDAWNTINANAHETDTRLHSLEDEVRSMRLLLEVRNAGRTKLTYNGSPRTDSDSIAAGSGDGVSE